VPWRQRRRGWPPSTGPVASGLAPAVGEKLTLTGRGLAPGEAVKVRGGQLGPGRHPQIAAAAFRPGDGVAGCGRPACHPRREPLCPHTSRAAGPHRRPGRTGRRPPRARPTPRRPAGRRRGPGRHPGHRGRAARRIRGPRIHCDAAGGGGAAAGGRRGRWAAAGPRRPAGGDQPAPRLGPDTPSVKAFPRSTTSSASPWRRSRPWQRPRGVGRRGRRG
jgi:hypothetical protein